MSTKNDNAALKFAVTQLLQDALAGRLQAHPTAAEDLVNLTESAFNPQPGGKIAHVTGGLIVDFGRDGFDYWIESLRLNRAHLFKNSTSPVASAGDLSESDIKGLTPAQKLAHANDLKATKEGWK